MSSFEYPQTNRSHLSGVCVIPQEHLNYVTEISQDELFVLDPELVVTETVSTSPGMPDLVDSSGDASSDPRKFAFPSSSSSPPNSPGPR